MNPSSFAKARVAFTHQVSADDIPREIFDQVPFPVKTRYAARLLAQRWEKDWEESHPDKAALIKRIDDMGNSRIQENTDEETERSNRWLAMEEPAFADGTYYRCLHERELAVVRHMAEFLQKVGKRAPREITGFLEDTASPHPERE